MNNKEISSTRSGASATTPAPSPFPVPDKAGAGYFAMNGGWIKLHREIKDHWLWGDPIRFQRWISLLLDANYEHKFVLIKGQLIECGRGQIVKSLDTFAREWLVTKKSVKRFLELLRDDQMIDLENVQISTRITICNYDKYQQQVNAEETQSKRKVNAEETQSKRTRPPTKNIKKEKKDKNVKNNTTDAIAPGDLEAFLKFQKWISEHAPRVNEMKNPFTASEFIAAKKAIPTADITSILTEMHNYKPLLTKNISSYLTLCNWHRRRRESGHASMPQHKQLSAAEAAAKIDRKWEETVNGAR